MVVDEFVPSTPVGRETSGSLWRLEGAEQRASWAKGICLRDSRSGRMGVAQLGGSWEFLPPGGRMGRQSQPAWGSGG